MIMILKQWTIDVVILLLMSPSLIAGQNNELSDVTIIGIIFGSIIALILIVAIIMLSIFFWYKRLCYCCERTIYAPEPTDIYFNTGYHQERGQQAEAVPPWINIVMRDRQNMPKQNRGREAPVASETNHGVY